MISKLLRGEEVTPAKQDVGKSIRASIEELKRLEADVSKEKGRDLRALDENLVSLSGKFDLFGKEVTDMRMKVRENDQYVGGALISLRSELEFLRKQKQKELPITGSEFSELAKFDKSLKSLKRTSKATNELLKQLFEKFEGYETLLVDLTLRIGSLENLLQTGVDFACEEDTSTEIDEPTRRDDPFHEEDTKSGENEGGTERVVGSNATKKRNARRRRARKAKIQEFQVTQLPHLSKLGMDGETRGDRS
mmetsp:Transcript_76892/g.89340  ORF Transcript_76892/g.89340 Transcript_76892/m.89340 type:complete len:250 (-) Transcript_76892:380-1129(-)|eukprot:CAMPEP_0176416530 /NCGR_PEP_ID=MMETSP0127-20121128/6396_1 /TAXON_ID=938130 /ORGANISM="Platyophrya macrostoma, Strain WH" /LENGTH=249 /DNA_ID=CAMNT_0017796613 /DNA_START=34 /DNA_END=783 /DNA_ORIENTATION=+